MKPVIVLTARLIEGINNPNAGNTPDDNDTICHSYIPLVAFQWWASVKSNGGSSARSNDRHVRAQRSRQPDSPSICSASARHHPIAVKLWTYRFRPTGLPIQLDIDLETSWSYSRLVVRHNGNVYTDKQNYFEDAYRLHEIEMPTPLGIVLIQVGPQSAWNYSAVIQANGIALWQSHENPHAYLDRMQSLMTSKADGKPAFEPGIWRRNMPSILVDMALGILFFALGKTTDLRTAAIVTALVGLALLPIQWMVKRLLRRDIDLLGGMALFGVVMLILSAGFSWYFDTEFAVQLKASVMGSIAGSLFFLDACFGGRWLAKRLASYLAYRDLQLSRLAWGMALTSFLMAGINLFIALSFSKDIWLYYTTWGDILIVILLTQWTINWARR